MNDNPLGKPTDYPTQYDPGLLFAVPRSDARAPLGLGASLPFHGCDIWNAYELTWLGPGGKPVAATGVITVDAATPNIVESKSLKLYLNSFAMTEYPSAAAVAATLERDLGAVAGGHVGVAVTTADKAGTARIDRLPGECIDDAAVGVDTYTVDADLLGLTGDDTVYEELHSHLLRSNCPVTGQPDIGSLLVRYQGPRIDRESLLRYLVSYREHTDFHEACVERMFRDVKARCRPERLTVYARFNRRGGLDINPFRSDFEDAVDNCRLWRQ